jgi:hypothetical protein
LLTETESKQLGLSSLRKYTALLSQVYLFVAYLTVLSILLSIALNGGLLMNGVLQNMWKEATIAHFEV